jgi:hypothetical protein
MLKVNYILFDAARMGEDMEEAKRKNPDHLSLYSGRSAVTLAPVAPYFFSFQTDTLFGQWYLEKGWGGAWGILLKSSYDKDELYKHFRKFLFVQIEQGEEFYFRFYDPHVLKIFFPTCDKDQILEFFGPVDYFITEGDSPEEGIKFWQQNGILQQRKLSVSEIFGEGVSATSEK